MLGAYSSDFVVGLDGSFDGNLGEVRSVSATPEQKAQAALSLLTPAQVALVSEGYVFWDAAGEGWQADFGTQTVHSPHGFDISFLPWSGVKKSGETWKAYSIGDVSPGSEDEKRQKAYQFAPDYAFYAAQYLHKHAPKMLQERLKEVEQGVTPELRQKLHDAARNRNKGVPHEPYSVSFVDAIISEATSPPSQWLDLKQVTPKSALAQTAGVRPYNVYEAYGDKIPLASHLTAIVEQADETAKAKTGLSVVETPPPAFDGSDWALLVGVAAFIFWPRGPKEEL